MGAQCCRERKKRWNGRDIEMSRYGEASRRFRQVVRRLIRLHISAVAFSPEPFSAYKCVGMEEVCRAEEEEFEKIMARRTVRKGVSAGGIENREAQRDVRFDPADGLPLTKEEMLEKYRGTYSKEELEEYWDEMPATAPEEEWHEEDGHEEGGDEGGKGSSADATEVADGVVTPAGPSTNLADDVVAAPAEANSAGSLADDASAPAAPADPEAAEATEAERGATKAETVATEAAPEMAPAGLEPTSSKPADSAPPTPDSEEATPQ